jgi:diguanylate cyclase (GGDEF)-like protein
MLDLDHFERINDQYGQVTGEAVLQIVVNRLLQGLRPSDLIGRYAGEKFAVLLPRTAWDDACTVAERLRGHIEMNMIDVGFNNIPLTISVGVAGLTPGTHSLAELLDHADQALAIAKSRNGNRWVVWRAPE